MSDLTFQGVSRDGARIVADGAYVAEIGGVPFRIRIEQDFRFPRLTIWLAHEPSDRVLVLGEEKTVSFELDQKALLRGSIVPVGSSIGPYVRVSDEPTGGLLAIAAEMLADVRMDRSVLGKVWAQCHAVVAATLMDRVELLVRLLRDGADRKTIDGLVTYIDDVLYQHRYRQPFGAPGFGLCRLNDTLEGEVFAVTHHVHDFSEAAVKAERERGEDLRLDVVVRGRRTGTIRIADPEQADLSFAGIRITPLSIEPVRDAVAGELA